MEREMCRSGYLSLIGHSEPFIHPKVQACLRILMCRRVSLTKVIEAVHVLAEEGPLEEGLKNEGRQKPSAQGSCLYRRSERSR